MKGRGILMKAGELNEVEEMEAPKSVALTFYHYFYN